MSADDFVCSLDPSIVAQYGVEACRSMAPKNNGDKDEGSNGSLVIVIILGILLLGGGIFYFRRR